MLEQLFGAAPFERDLRGARLTPVRRDSHHTHGACFRTPKF